MRALPRETLIQVVTASGARLLGPTGSVVTQGEVIPGVVTEPTTWLDVGSTRVNVEEISSGNAKVFVHDPARPQPVFSPDEAGQMIFPGGDLRPIIEDRPGVSSWDELEEQSKQFWRDHGTAVLARAGITVAEEPEPEPAAPDLSLTQGYRVFDPDAEGQQWPTEGQPVIVTRKTGEQTRGTVEMRLSRMNLGLAAQQITEDTVLSIQADSGERFEVTEAQLRGGQVSLYIPEPGAGAEAETTSAAATEAEMRMARALRGRKGTDVWANYLTAEPGEQAQFLSENGISDPNIPGVQAALSEILDEESRRRIPTGSPADPSTDAEAPEPAAAAAGEEPGEAPAASPGEQTPTDSSPARQPAADSAGGGQASGQTDLLDQMQQAGRLEVHQVPAPQTPSSTAASPEPGTEEPDPGQPVEEKPAAEDATSPGAAGKTGTKLSYADIEPVELPTGVRSRIEANLAALETLNTVEQQNRYATAEEMTTIASYTGWGGLAEVFDPADERFTSHHAKLKDLISEQAYHTLRSSILNAHYTPPALAEAIWDPIREATAGRESLRVLEPGSGTGMFFRTSGLAGTDTAHQFVGVEMDETTARISAALHPEAEIHHSGFEETRFAENSFDLAVGNVPFGNFSLPDPVHNTAGLSIHNHFIYKALAHTAPGGYVALITSRYTMDAKAESARQAMARHGDLVGAVRLPEGAQSSLSGTQVGTDVLIFRKREPGVKPDPETLRWTTTTTGRVSDREGVPHEFEFNTYFDEHPENVLGSVEFSSNPYGPGYQISGPTGEALAEQVRSRITAIITETDLEFNAHRSLNPEFSPGIHTPPEPEARYGHVRYNTTSGQFEEYTSQMSWEPLSGKRKPKKAAKAETLALIGIRDAARQVISAQRDGTPAAERDRLRADLKTAWESYRDTYGPINRREAKYAKPRADAQKEIRAGLAAQWLAENRPDVDTAVLTDEQLSEIAEGTSETVELPEGLIEQWRAQAAEPVFSHWEQAHLRPFEADPSRGLLLAVENIDRDTEEASPAPLLERDMVTPTAKATSAATAEEAVGISMAEQGRVDTERVAQLLGVDHDEVGTHLEGVAFTDPETGRVEPAPTYLSGDVRAKLDAAIAAAEADPGFQSNVAALEGVIPETIPLDEVTINPGVPWLDKEVYEQFAYDTFGVPVEIVYNEHAKSGKWQVVKPDGVKPDQDVIYKWSTNHGHVTPFTVLSTTLNSQAFKLTKPDPSDPKGEKRLPDPEASDAANDKSAQLKAEFKQWVKADPERAAAIEERYNRLFNSIVPADYSGLAQQLELPGLSETRQPYSYQRTAVARALNEPAVLLDHVVGAGKTGTMIITAMEKRRLGHANKPALVVPNHLVGQIADEWKQWYPAAEIMPIPGALGPKEKRERFARAAAGDWDAVIIAESVFKEVSIDPVRHQAMMEADIAQMRDNVAQMRAEGASKAAIRKAEGDIKGVERRYRALQDKSDDGLVFEETGIDFLMVDEAHHFKNLRRSSDVPELDGGLGSKQAENLHYILRAMREDRIDRAKAEGTYTEGYVPSVVMFSTGTPVANKVSEMWVMQTYLRPDLLAERGISDVNAWGATFTEQDWRIIATPDGRYQRALKVTGFANVPELLAFNRSFQDSVSRADLEVALPEVVGGERKLHVLDPSEDVEEFMQQLQARVDKIKSGGVDPRTDNVLKIVHEGRMAALDPRLMGMDAPVDGGRAAAVADEVMRIHESTKDNIYTTAAGEPSQTRGGLQIVFADLSTPRPEDPEQFTIYQELREQLIDRGMDPQRIAFIHDAATDAERVELFEKARSGQISVLVGSTQKMGTGMNVQDRAVALHHIDPPWRPADIEQREGRIIRQGNQNAVVEIHAYGTAGTTDTFMWSKLSQKAGFIEQLKNPSGVGRTMEDPLGGIDATAANAQAVLSGDPRIGQVLELESEIATLERLEQHHLTSQAQKGAEAARHTKAAQTYEERLPQLRELASQVTETRGDKFRMVTPEGTVVTTRAEAGEIIAGHVRRAAHIADDDSLKPTRPVPVGTLGSVELTVHRHLSHVHISTPVPGHEARVGAETVRNGNKSAEGLIRTAENLVASTEEKITKWENDLAYHRRQAQGLTETLGEPWERGEELEAKRDQYAQLRAELDLDAESEAEEAAEPITGAALAALVDGETTIRRGEELRDGDVVRLAGGENGHPNGPGFYRVKHDTAPDTGHYAEEGATVDVVMAWKEGEDPSTAVAIDIRTFYNNNVELVSREPDQLTEFERQLAATAEDPSTRIVKTYTLQPGMRIQVAREGTGEIVSGTVVEFPDEPRHRRMGIHPDGWDEPTVLLDPDNGINAATILQTDYQPPEEPGRDAGAAAAPQPVRQLAYGRVLTEDVEDLGHAGEIIISPEGRYGETRILNPDTGVARQYVRYQRLEPHQHTDPLMLTAAEKLKLGAESPELIGTVEHHQLRPGDRVQWRDIDKTAHKAAAVTITEIWKHPYNGRTDLEFRHDDGTTGEVEIRGTAEVRLINRAKAFLPADELAALAVNPQSQLSGGGGIVPGVKEVEAADLLEPGDRIGAENPELVIIGKDLSGSPINHEIITGSLLQARQREAGHLEVDLLTSGGERSVIIDSEETSIAVTAHPLNITDLGLRSLTPAADATREDADAAAPERGRIVLDPDDAQAPLKRVPDPDDPQHYAATQQHAPGPVSTGPGMN